MGDLKPFVIGLALMHSTDEEFQDYAKWYLGEELYNERVQPWLDRFKEKA